MTSRRRSPNMSISSLVCPLCLCLVNVVVVVPAPFMSVGLKQSLLRSTNETTTMISTKSLDLLESSTKTNGTSSDDKTASEEVDMWSVLWYLGAFGGLVTFFLIVTCSEWCFGNHMYTRHGINELYANAYQGGFQENQRRVPDTPPPPYDLFAPPSYSDLFGKVPEAKKKSKINIFIIPIHRRDRNSSTSPAS